MGHDVHGVPEWRDETRSERELRTIEAGYLARTRQIEGRWPGLYRPPIDEPLSNLGRYTINGWPATIKLWTAEEWARLEPAERPTNAREFACGVWLALRMD